MSVSANGHYFISSKSIKESIFTNIVKESKRFLMFLMSLMFVNDNGKPMLYQFVISSDDPNVRKRLLQ